VVCDLLEFWNPKWPVLRTAKPLPNGIWALGSFLLQLLINLFFVIMHPALYEHLISYVHVAHDLEFLIRLILINGLFELQIGEIFFAGKQQPIIGKFAELESGVFRIERAQQDMRERKPLSSIER
jgi:hypothetical protein